MAKSKWVKTLTSTEIGFEVLNVRPADRKEGYVVTTVKYPTVDHTYEYCRKATPVSGAPRVNATVIDGCEVQFNKYSYEVLKVTRLYDTKGMRKAVNPGGAGKTTSEKIKGEIEDKGVDIPCGYTKSN